MSIKYFIFSLVNINITCKNNVELKNLVKFTDKNLQESFNIKKEFYKNMLIEYLTKFTKSPKSFQEIKEVIIFLRNFYNQYNITLTNKDLQFFLKKYTAYDELTTNFSNYLEIVPYKENTKSIAQYYEGNSISIINYNQNITEEFIEYQSNYLALKELNEFDKISENESWYYHTVDNKISVAKLKFINRNDKYILNRQNHESDTLEIINQLIIATKIEDKYYETLRNFLLDVTNLLMEIYEYHINEKDIDKNIKIIDKIIEKNGRSTKTYFCFAPYLTQIYLHFTYINGVFTNDFYAFIHKENNDYYLYTILNDKYYIKNKIKNYKKFLVAYWTYLILLDPNIDYENNIHKIINQKSLENKYTSILTELLGENEFSNF